MNMQNLDFDNLPSNREVEQIINDMDFDTTLTHINICRRRQLDNPQFEPTTEEIRAGFLLVRRLRSLRETKSPTKRKATKKTKGFASLTDML